MTMEIGQGFGSVLAEARVAKGLTVAEVAEKLKLAPRQVEAIEAEDLSRLPSAVFVRGFARNYARLLDLSPDDLPGLSAGSVEPTSTLVAPSEDVVFRSAPVRRRQFLPWLGLILLVVMIGVLYVWLRQGEKVYPAAGVQNEQTVVPLQPQQPPVQMAPPPVAAKSQNAAGAPKPEARPPASPTNSAVNEPGPANSAANEPGAANAGAGSEHVVHIVAEGGKTWVQILFADKKRYRHLLQAGEQWTVRGMSPVRLVVGDAAHTRLLYDGKPVALTPSAGSLTARLTLE